MKINHIVTDRGFSLIQFTDRDDETCSLQKSSLATENAIWFGLKNDRMHLTQERVKALLPYLQHFADTGELP